MPAIEIHQLGTAASAGKHLRSRLEEGALRHSRCSLPLGLKMPQSRSYFFVYILSRPRVRSIYMFGMLEYLWLPSKALLSQLPQQCPEWRDLASRAA